MHFYVLFKDTYKRQNNVALLALDFPLHVFQEQTQMNTNMLLISVSLLRI